MTRRERIREHCLERLSKHASISQLGTAVDWVHEWRQSHPEGTQEECKEAALGAGLLVEIAIISLVIQIAYSLYMIWNRHGDKGNETKEKTSEETKEQGEPKNASDGQAS